MHVGLFVTASQEHTVRPSKSFGAESGGGETGYPANSSRRAFATNSGLSSWLNAYPGALALPAARITPARSGQAYRASKR